MSKRSKFKYVVADSGVGSHNHMFSLDSEYGNFDCHDSCIVWNSITFYGVSPDLSDAELDDIGNGDYTKAIKIGSILGCLILCKQILAQGQDPWDICDGESGNLEATISALKREGCPLNDDEGDPWQDVYYIHEWKMDKGYNSATLKSEILERLPKIILLLFHVKPDILAYFPTPLEYTPDPNLQARLQALEYYSREKLQAAFNSMGHGDSASVTNTPESNIRSFGLAYKLSEKEQDELIEKIQSIGAYPESAKRKREFSFFESNGFVEAGNSRLLFKISEE